MHCWATAATLFLFSEPQNLHILLYERHFVFVLQKYTLNANEIIRAFKTKYEIKDEGGIKWFLSIRVVRDKEARKVFFLHDAYIKKIAAKF
jgi:hypothetical protein